MGMLHNGHHVWLRSPVGPYLHADHAYEDERGVSLHPRRASQNAACAVHLFRSDGLYVLPHGSCGRYLAALALASASASPAPTGHRGVEEANAAPSCPLLIVNLHLGNDRTPSTSAEAMGMLQNGHHVWLRSPVGPYIHADEDGRGVSLHPRRASQNAACAVHLFRSDGLYVLPPGSCGRYLAALALASASPAPTGQAEVEVIMWQVVMSETGDDVLLRHVSGRFLSAIGRYQWHNGSIVDNSTMVVEAIPRRQEMPSLPGSPLQRIRCYGRMTPLVLDLPRSNEPMDIVILTSRGRSINLLGLDLYDEEANAAPSCPLLIANLHLGNDRMDIVELPHGAPAVVRSGRGREALAPAQQQLRAVRTGYKAAGWMRWKAAIFKVLHRWVVPSMKRLLPLPDRCSWLSAMGEPIPQTASSSCTIVACTVCIEALHRREFERLYGAGTFFCKAAYPRKLRRACLTNKIWDPKKGAAVGPVLRLIMLEGGVPTTNAPQRSLLLPLSGFQSYDLFDNDCFKQLVSRKAAAQIIHVHGPCIAALFVESTYFDRYDNNDDDDSDPMAYPGVPRDEKLRSYLEKDDKASSHAVVCYSYRFVGDDLHLRVLDNQTPQGPRRWVVYEAFDMLLALRVKPLHPELLYCRLY